MGLDLIKTRSRFNFFKKVITNFFFNPNSQSQD